MLGRRDVGHARPIPFRKGRQRPFGVVLGAVVAAFRVDPGEAVEYGPGSRGPQLVGPVGELDARRLEHPGRHLRGQRSLPDQTVQAPFVAADVASDRVRVALEAGWSDGLVRLLRGARPGPVRAPFRRGVGIAEARSDHVAGLADRLAGQGDRIGAHVGDQADLAISRVDTLVQPLRHGHRALRAEAELAARLLLESRGGERRRRIAVLALDRQRADDRVRGAERLGVAGRGRFVADLRLGPVEPDEVGREGLPGGGREAGLEGPVLARDERADLALAIDHEANGDRLDAAG